tara:strand:- start:229 stop:576 length:348 start_codon:yes stop_codon:yes gene_type:complete
MNLHSITKKYLSSWNTRDKSTLQSIFAEDITLQDWNVKVHGRENVINANADIWENVPDIHVLLMHIGVCEKLKKSYAEITVVSQKENLHIKVIDVISFDKNNKIIKVDAFHQEST